MVLPEFSIFQTFGVRSFTAPVLNLNAVTYISNSVKPRITALSKYARNLSICAMWQQMESRISKTSVCGGLLVSKYWMLMQRISTFYNNSQTIFGTKLFLQAKFSISYVLLAVSTSTLLSLSVLSAVFPLQMWFHCACDHCHVDK